MTHWRFIGSCYDIERFVIDGVNVWEHRWTDSGRGTVEVKDPYYERTLHPGVWEIRLVVSEKTIVFAALEVASNLYAFWVPD